MPTFLAIDLANGKYESAAFPMTQGFFTVQANFTKVNSEAVVQVLQSADGVEFSPILDDRKTPIKMRLIGSGSKTINMVGATSVQGKVLIIPVPPTPGGTAEGIVDEVHVLA